MKEELLLVVSAVVVKLGNPEPVGPMGRVELKTGKGAEVVVVRAEVVEKEGKVVDVEFDPVMTKPGPGLGVTASCP